MHPKVSIVVPVYNKIKYIDAMLESVYNQVWNNIQLILVNDGATDGTRERLDAWKSRLEKRGFIVEILDQENLGINAAIQNGLRRVTGTFCCCVDCDDWLYPEYVSAMAGFLHQNEAYDWCICQFESYIEETGCTTRRIPRANPTLPDFLVQYILAQFPAPTWLYMIRTTYLHRCKIVDNFITEPRGCQEPCLALPLIVNGGKVGYLQQPLYRHNLPPRREVLLFREEHIPNYYENLLLLQDRVLHLQGIQPRERRRLMTLRRLTFEKLQFEDMRHLPSSAREQSMAAKAEAIANYINLMYEPAPGITAEDILTEKAKFLWNAVVCNALGAFPKDFPEQGAKRVIGYGVLGQAAKKLLRQFLDAGFPITEMWDKAAGDDAILFGKPVAPPALESLGKGDLLLLFPTEARIAEEVCGELDGVGFHNILSNDDITDCLSQYYYPQFFGECCLNIE